MNTYYIGYDNPVGRRCSMHVRAKSAEAAVKAFIMRRGWGCCWSTRTTDRETLGVRYCSIRVALNSVPKFYTDLWAIQVPGLEG